MKKLVFIVGISMLLFSSCLKDDDLDQQRNQQLTSLKEFLTSNNITYVGTDTVYQLYLDTSLRDTSSKPIGSTNYVKINYNLRLLDGTLVETNNFTLAKEKGLRPVVALKGPALIAVNYSSIYGVYRSLMKLEKNDTAEFVIPYSWAFDSYYTSLIPIYSSLRFQVRIVDVIPDIVAYDKSFWKQWVVDSLKLSSLDDTTSDIPVYMKTLKSGDTTKTPDEYSNVTVIYKGWLTDGRCFTSDYDTITFTLGSSSLIDGFKTAAKNMHLAERAKVFIPYYHAYGKKAQYNSYSQVVIPPYSSVIYEMFLYSINSK
jgi:FKBP-type peptidyl-prolyl cis-trans isomerase